MNYPQRMYSKTELGLFDKRWNKNVHGPYVHHRYYGTREFISSFVLLSFLHYSPMFSRIISQ